MKLDVTKHDVTNHAEELQPIFDKDGYKLPYQEGDGGDRLGYALTGNIVTDDRALTLENNACSCGAVYTFKDV